MTFISKKKRIYVGLGVLVIATFIIFWFIFPAIESGNLSAANKVLSKSKQYQELLQQQASYEAGKSDLETLTKKPYQPSDFFSKDTSVVKEIETLENLAKDEKLKLDLQVTGTKSTGQKAPTTGDIVQVPYTLSLTGSLAGIEAFLERFENLKFITHAQSVEFASVTDGEVKANLSAIFFVQK